MKIIAQTPGGYIAEVSRQEMEKLTGKSERSYGSFQNTEHTHRAGTTVEVVPVSQHLAALATTEGKRKGVAEQLRTIADIVEKTPVAFLASENPAPAEGVGGA